MDYYLSTHMPLAYKSWSDFGLKGWSVVEFGPDSDYCVQAILEWDSEESSKKALASEAAGVVTIEDTDRQRKIILTPDNGDEPFAYPVLKRATLLIEDGQHVELGTQFHVGSIDPKEVLRVKGVRAVQLHLVDGVQGVYRSQGVPIHDKHIEVIVRQMLRKVTVVDHGETDLLPGELVDRSRYQDVNRAALAEGRKTASARQEVMGITKASLATESWLSAASFQETTRVLTQAAMEGKSDPLMGLKENVIIGKLIPAGTGLPRYRNVRIEPTEEAKAAMYSAVGYDDIDYSPFGTGSGQAVPLEDYDYGPYNQ